MDVHLLHQITQEIAKTTLDQMSQEVMKTIPCHLLPMLKKQAFTSSNMNMCSDIHRAKPEMKSVLFFGLDVWTFKISYHQGMLVVLVVLGQHDDSCKRIQLLVRDLWSVKCGLDQGLFSKGYELSFKEKLKTRLRIPCRSC